jgi:SOS response regulatory protein OraA/RecX
MRPKLSRKRWRQRPSALPRVTSLTADRTGTRVLVELDGTPWRSIPVEAAVRAGLATELELERGDLRRLRRELRRGEALDAAARALRHRDRSSAWLHAKLRVAGHSPWACEQALDALMRAGVVDDQRFAVDRARALADRGSGDALIRADLDGAGISEAEATRAIDALAPEHERAIRLAEARGQTLATARWLARKGFGEDAIEAALPTFVADES